MAGNKPVTAIARRYRGCCTSRVGIPTKRKSDLSEKPTRMIIEGTVRSRDDKRSRPPWSRVCLILTICRLRRSASLTSALILVAVGVAGCGGSARASSEAATAHTGLDMARCMRAHGVPNFPDPTASTGGSIAVEANGSGNSLTVNGVKVNAPAFQSAMKTCQRYMPTGHVSATRFEKIRKGALAMAKCMRAHGVPNFPDPLVSDGPQGLIVHGNLKAAHIDINTPAFQHAMTTCQPLEGLPAPGAK